jgi:membrane-bound lytic murein transglycosylase D
MTPTTALQPAQHRPALRPVSAALAALLLALGGCASVPSDADLVEPPPQITQLSQGTGTTAPADNGTSKPAPAPVAAPAVTLDLRATRPAPAVNATESANDNGQAAGPPQDPLEPEQLIRLDDQHAREDLWARVRAGFGMPDLDNDLVREHERWYASRPDYVQRMTTRGSLYLYHVMEEVQKRKMPAELALLPFIESAFNPRAMSTAKASGMWQFIPSTGKDYDLKQNIFRDDRRDVLASTRAALDYLGRLNKLFGGDWQLALAAYNWGEGNVGKAIARNQRAGLPIDYMSLNMPDETRHYVPKLQAVKNIVLRPQQFDLALPALKNHPYFLSVPIERDMDVAVAARLAGLSMDEFKTLNPQMNKPVILAAGTPQLLLPYDNAAQFVERLAQQRGPVASWTAWVVPRTMRTADAAKEVGMSEAALREINLVPPRMLVKAGSTLLVPRSEQRTRDVPEHVADNAQMALAPDLPPMKRVSIRARKGETFASLAKRYKVSASQLAQWNQMSTGASLRPGQALVMLQPQRAGKAAASSRATERRTAEVDTKDKATTKVRGKNAARAGANTAAASAKPGKSAAKSATAPARSTVRVASAKPSRM